MVVEAVNWSGEHHTRRGVLGSPRLARYAVGWGRPGDLGLVAVDLEGPRGLQVPVGAAWLRYFPSKEPGYGFVAPGIPEVSLAIVPGYRRRGIGRALLINLLARARAQGTGHVSLSVARANPALALYEALGFQHMPDAPGASAESVTLVLDLILPGSTRPEPPDQPA
ncbi:MAG: GNAT family N-acetyltransferase [Salana multivorans]|nr:GNAT family N-acetyltransferase [Salana multivorans]